MTKTIALWSPKGGQGVSTIAVGLASHLQRTSPRVRVQLVSESPDGLLAILGMGVASDALDNWDYTEQLNIARGEFGNFDYRVFDFGTTIPDVPVDLTLMVTKACYLSLRKSIALRNEERLVSDGFILVEESGRSLNASDIEHVLDMRHLFTIPSGDAPGICRTVDAGLMGVRVNATFARLATAVLYETPNMTGV